ncbi:MAG: serine protease [Myxococcota bacterium]|nr:serine protease [Myxococcota bacterium]
MRRENMSLGRQLIAALLSLSVSPIMASCTGDRPLSEEARSTAKSISSEREHLRAEVKLEEREDQVIYGEDDRMDLYEARLEPALRERALRSIVALVPERQIVRNNPSDIRFRGRILGESLNLCADQRFWDQPRISNCSGTLIDDDIVVTAGHCIESQRECENTTFVFGYYMDDPEDRAVIPAGQLYPCGELLLSVNNRRLDYAFIRLERPADPAHAEPAPVFREQVPLTRRDPLVMMGFPSGIPLKVDSGGYVVNARADELDFFRATVDAFGGNSGSGVFDAEGRQVGILVRGEQDYEQDRSRGCQVVNELPEERAENQDAEELTYFATALADLCDQGFVSDRLCPEEERGGWCAVCEEDGECLEGWRCAPSPAPGIPGTCAPSCNQREPCRPDHECVDGLCEPLQRQVCDSDRSVRFEDGCGRDLERREDCGLGFCRNGSCILPGEGDRCESASEIEPVSQRLEGNLQGPYSNQSAGRCGGRGVERVYRFTLAQENRIRATAQGFDTVLYLRRGCDEEALFCNDDSDPPGRFGSRIEGPLEPGTYHLFIDTFSGETGNYSLDLELCPAVCERGAQRCVGGGVSLCDVDASGCVRWLEPTLCEAGTRCSDGACIRAEQGDGCATAFEVDAVDQRIEGVIDERWRSDFLPGCAGEQRADQLYRFRIERELRLVVEGSGALDTVSLWSSCDALPLGELQCARSADALRQVLTPGDYSLVIGAQEAGEYQLDLRFEPLCVDSCAPGAVDRCDESGLQIERCVEGESGCFEWRAVTECVDPARCIAGQCIEDCFHECERLDETRCLDESVVGRCVEDEAGCRVLSSERVCDEGCEGGRCIGDPTPEDWRTEEMSVAPVDLGVGFNFDLSQPPLAPPPPRPLPPRPRAGCSAQPAPAFPPLWTIFFASLFVLHMRRKRAPLAAKGVRDVC